MRTMPLFAAMLIMAHLIPQPVQAQRLVSALSNKVVSIDSSFSGETLTLFGNVEPEAGAADEHPGRGQQHEGGQPGDEGKE